MELAGDVVEQLVAVVDDVRLVNRQHCAWARMWGGRQVAVRVDGNKLWHVGETVASDLFCSGPVRRTFTPRTWPEPVVLDVEEHAIGHAEIPSS